MLSIFDPLRDVTLLSVAVRMLLAVLCGGAIGIGEITSIPTAPAIAEAYYRYDGERRTALPLSNTPYSKK